MAGRSGPAGCTTSPRCAPTASKTCSAATRGPGRGRCRLPGPGPGLPRPGQRPAQETDAKTPPPEETASWEQQRHQQSSQRICVEHAIAEPKQWRALQRWTSDAANTSKKPLSPSPGWSPTAPPSGNHTSQTRQTSTPRPNRAPTRKYVVLGPSGVPVRPQDTSSGPDLLKSPEAAQGASAPEPGGAAKAIAYTPRAAAALAGQHPGRAGVRRGRAALGEGRRGGRFHGEPGVAGHRRARGHADHAFPGRRQPDIAARLLPVEAGQHGRLRSAGGQTPVHAVRRVRNQRGGLLPPDGGGHAPSLPDLVHGH